MDFGLKWTDAVMGINQYVTASMMYISLIRKPVLILGVVDGYIPLSTCHSVLVFDKQVQCDILLNIIALSLAYYCH